MRTQQLNQLLERMPTRSSGTAQLLGVGQTLVLERTEDAHLQESPRKREHCGDREF
jgi:hypothetical protein